MVTGAQYAVSDTGTLVYIPAAYGGAAIRSELVWVDRNGIEESIPVPPDDYRGLRISPDGTRLAFTIHSGRKTDICVYDFERKNVERLVSADETTARSPIWSPDGRRVLFALGKGLSAAGLYWKSADGTGEIELFSKQALLPQSFSADGNDLIVLEGKGIGLTDIGLLPLKGKLSYVPLLKQSFPEFLARISPDGNWIVYGSMEAGQPKVYVRPFPEVNKERHSVAPRGGYDPLWSPEGRELFYRGFDGIYVVPVRTEASLKSAVPKRLFKDAYRYLPFADGSSWDIGPDGKRFLMLKPHGAAETGSTGLASLAPRKIVVVTNWFEELKRRVPSK
jgi:dipeptidyl aminopeptidase/acylaminoacyl peptidase